MAAPAERRRIEGHVERSEGQRVAPRAEVDVVAVLEPFGEPSVVELAGDASAGVEGIGSGARVLREEVGPCVERRGEIVGPASAVLGVVESELGERDHVLGP